MSDKENEILDILDKIIKLKPDKKVLTLVYSLALLVGEND